MIAVLAVMTVKEGNGAEFESVAAGLTAEVRANEEGANLLYQLVRSTTDPNVYTFMELYRDAEAMKAHAGSDHFKAAFPALLPFLAGEPKIEVLDAL